MYCGNCGSPMDKKTKFCGSCGAPTPKKKSSVLKIVLPIVMAVVILGGGVFALYHSGIIFNSDDKTTVSSNKDNKHAKPTKKPNKKPTSTPVVTSTPTADPTPVPTVDPTSLKANRTIMIYIVGSNLETYNYQATADLEEICAADLGDNTNVIIQTGGASVWHTAGFEDGKVQRWEVKDNKLVEIDNLGQLSMVEESTLVDFIGFTANTYPADNYILVLWDHGGGVPIGFGYDDIFPYDTLDDVEIGSALQSSGVHFETLLTDACLMCSLEFFKSIESNVEYAVAAESTVWAGSNPYTGVNYKTWLTLAAEDSKAIDYCELIVDDYMDYIHTSGLTGSMSVVRMDQIEEVYEAYVDFMTELSKNYDYATYYQARISCGEYETTDSVDLSTFAGAYPNAYTTELQNAVSNAVVRTSSDLPYGHGITVYSPINLVLGEGWYETYDNYTYGRASLVTLNYDSVIIDFYDNFVSQIYYENDWVEYAGDWYVGPSSTDTYKMTDPEVIYKDNYYALDISNSDWGVIKTVLMQMYTMDDQGNLIRIGVDTQYETDKDGDIIYSAPTSWLGINGYLPSSAAYVWEETNDGWYKIYLVMAYVNGEEAVLEVYCNQDNPEGTIIGFAYADFEEWEIGDLYDLFEDDVVELAQLKYDSKGNEFYEAISPELYVSDLTVGWMDPLDTAPALSINYYITDIYGGLFTTEFIDVQ